MSALVMVIDDSPTIRKILEVTLRREGMEVVSYSDGVEALRAIATRPYDRLPDLLFLDLELPRMNGFEARLAGTQAYLTKPCTRQMIIEVVRTSLGQQAALP